MCCPRWYGRLAADAPESLRWRRRQRDDEPGAVGVVTVDRDRAAELFDEAAGDGEAEASAAMAGAPRVIDAAEPLEDVGATLGGDARSIIGDDERHDAVVLAERQRDRCGGVAHGVVEQVADDTTELIAVADHLGGRHVPGVDRDP